MALSLLGRPSPSRARLMARLHHGSPASMGTGSCTTGRLELSRPSICPQVGSHFVRFRSLNGVLEDDTLLRGGAVCVDVPPLRSVPYNTKDGHPLHTPSSLQVLGFSSTLRTSVWRHGWVYHSGGAKMRYSCSSSGPINGPSHSSAEIAGSSTNDSHPQQDSNTSNRAYTYQQQPQTQPANNNMTQQQQPSNPTSFNPNQHSTHVPGNQWAQQPRQAPRMGAPSSGAFTPGNQNGKQSEYAARTGAPLADGKEVSSAPRVSNQSPPNVSSPGTTAGASTPPRTSAAAEVIDKYLGPSTLKLEKRDDKSPPPPPPPPPRRNYGSQGTQEKKSGKDLVAESAACAVIEKYLGPWPGFPPRDPKIDEYLDSLPENAACAAIDKYFGPYKPLFVFKKNEGDANHPPPPSRPPRNRMMSRARNRAWNASQQGASIDRPWTAPQQGPPVDATQGGQPSQSTGAPPSQGAAPPEGRAAMPVTGTMQSQPGTIPPQLPPQQRSNTIPPPHAGNMSPPHGAGFSPPGNNGT